jgi:hypothetical protein
MKHNPFLAAYVAAIASTVLFLSFAAALLTAHFWK